MPMAEWIDKYPGVKALLQADGDVLESPVAEEETPPQPVLDWTPELTAMAQEVTQRLVAHIPFLLHVELWLLSARVLGVSLRCEEGVELSGRLSLEVYHTSQQQSLDVAVAAWADAVTLQVAKRRAAAWLATKQANEGTALFQDGDFTHQRGMPFVDGYPPRTWRFAMPTRLPVVSAWITAVPNPAPIACREYRLREYDPITRVAWYEPS